jgi:hypothetical protein
MGCQMESHGAALKAYQLGFGPKGLFVCGLVRQEHPYDVEDYVRHFKVSFPIFVDLNEDSSRECMGGLDSAVVLDANHKRLPERGEPYQDPLAARATLAQLFESVGQQPSPPAKLPEAAQPKTNSARLSPRLLPPGWSQPVQLGRGKYPKLLAYGTNQALCVWVEGEVPAQRLAFAVFNGQGWQARQPLPAGEDAHAPALDVDSQGRPVMVWAQKTAGNYRVYLRAFTGLTWQEPTALSPAGADAFRPDVYCQPSGELAVAWYAWKIVQLRSNPDSWWRSIFLTTVANGQPGRVRELARLERGSDDCWDPLITGAGQDLRVVWLRDENPPRLFCSAQESNRWSRPKPLLDVRKGRDIFCCVRAASPIRGPGRRNGVVYELNLTGSAPPLVNGIQVYLQQLNLEGWSEPTLVSSGAGRHLAPVAVEDSAGELLVFWWCLEGQRATLRMRAFDRAGAAAASAETLTSGDCRSLYPSASAAPDGRLWLAWEAEQPGMEPGIFVSSKVSPRQP